MLRSATPRDFDARAARPTALLRARTAQLRAIATLSVLVFGVAASRFANLALADARGGLHISDGALRHILEGDIVSERQAVPVCSAGTSGAKPGQSLEWRLLRHGVSVIDGGLHTQAAWERFLAQREREHAPVLPVAAALELPLGQLVFVSETTDGKRAATVPVFEGVVDPRTGVTSLTLPRAALSARALGRAREQGERAGVPLSFARKALFPAGMVDDPEAFARLLEQAYGEATVMRSQTPEVRLREARVSAQLPQGRCGEPFPLRIATTPEGELISAYPYFDRSQLFLALPDPTPAALLSALQLLKVLDQRAGLRGLPAVLQHLPEALSQRLEQVAAESVRAVATAGVSAASPLTVDQVVSSWGAPSRHRQGEARKARGAARVALAPLFAAAAAGAQAAEPWRDLAKSCARALPLTVDAANATNVLKRLVLLADLAVDGMWGRVARCAPRAEGRATPAAAMPSPRRR